MATRPITLRVRPRIHIHSQNLRQVPSLLSQSQCICRCHRSRFFSSSTKLRQNYKDSFGTRLRRALNDTKIKWYPIPVGLGIGFLGLGQLYRINEREKEKRRLEDEEDDGYMNIAGHEGQPGGRPKRRDRIRPSGPWFASFIRK